MEYLDIGNIKQQCNNLVLWIYSRSQKLEVKKGYTHSRLNKSEDPWKGNLDELARGKFNPDMRVGSIAFCDNNILIQRLISDELQSRFKESIFYVFGAPNHTGGTGVLLEEFLEGKHE